VNEVALVGRLSAAAEERVLPSGDVLLTWRVVVDRPPPRKPRPDGGRQASIDALDCFAFAPVVRRTVSSFAAGDVVRVQGALRRRFWQGPAGTQSRTEVEVARAQRLGRAQASR
jgi:single-strand DNA-binding protein